MKIRISPVNHENNLHMAVRPEVYGAAFPGMMKLVPRAWWDRDKRVWLAPREADAVRVSEHPDRPELLCIHLSLELRPMYLERMISTKPMAKYTPFMAYIQFSKVHRRHDYGGSAQVSSSNK